MHNMIIPPKPTRKKKLAVNASKASDTLGPLTKMIKEGTFPEEIANQWLNFLEETKTKINNAIEQDSLSIDEIISTSFPSMKGIMPYSLEKLKLEIEEQQKTFRLLWENRGSSTLENLSNQFIKGIDPRFEFPSPKVIMDRLYHLPELMEKATLINITDNEWILNARIPTNIKSNQDYKGDAGPIGIEYSFSASSKEEAEKISESYKKEIIENGFKVYLAFSKMMEIKKSFQYSCKLIDVMKLISDPERKNPFTQKERADFFRILLLLERTKLTIEIRFNIKGAKKHTTEKVSIEQRLLDINLKDKKRKVPSFVGVSMLDADKFKNKGTKATRIANNTLLLTSRRITFSAIIQTRFEQRSGLEISYDESNLIKLAGLEETARSNPTVAKKRLRDDLNEFHQQGILSGWREDKGRYFFSPPIHRKLKKHRVAC
jgi:hypothetical protein